MKLASLKQGRDGQLVVVSNDLTRAVSVTSLCQTLQQALDNWDYYAPKLNDIAESLELGALPSFRFHENDCASPLPRAFQWADGSAYINHVELVRKARGVEMPPSFYTDPLMYQGGSDSFLAPREDICHEDEDYGIDFEGEVAVIVGDVKQGATREEALNAIRLIMLANDVSLRNLITPELTKGFGFVQSKPATAFSPVAVTPQTLGSLWKDGKLHLPLQATLNGVLFGKPNAGVDMTFDFGTLIAHLAKTRAISAGSIIGSGTVSNVNANPVKGGGIGYSCIAEQRVVETLNTGKATTPFMRFGDTIRLEMLDNKNRSIFGAIEQTIKKLN
jgi:fumarylacetoacetate (FAA) hydrolase